MRMLSFVTMVLCKPSTHDVLDLEGRVLDEENITRLHTFQINELQVDHSDHDTRLGHVEETQNGIKIIYCYYYHIIGAR